MNWNDCIEEAKEELGIDGWTDNWNEVVNLAKEKYWKGDNFKSLKEDTIYSANNKCKLCDSFKNLTAHHIYYKTDDTICVCKECHELIHDLQDTNGFIMQIILDYWWKYDNGVCGTDADYKYPNLANSIKDCYNQLISEIKQRKNEKEKEKCHTQIHKNNKQTTLY